MELFFQVEILNMQRYVPICDQNCHNVVGNNYFYNSPHVAELIVQGMHYMAFIYAQALNLISWKYFLSQGRCCPVARTVTRRVIANGEAIKKKLQSIMGSLENLSITARWHGTSRALQVFHHCYNALAYKYCFRSSKLCISGQHMRSPTRARI